MVAATNLTSSVDGFRTAESLKLAFLQDPQQFGLQFHGKVADFVQKQGAALSLFEAADAVLQGAGVRRRGRGRRVRLRAGRPEGRCS